MRAFIYSLPRSGSAWLSVFLTGQDSFCFHEPTAEKIPTGTLFDSRPERVVCGVDTGAYLIAPTIGRALGARCFVLHRDTAQIQKSLRSLKFGRLDASEERRKLDQVTEGMGIIEYARLFDVGYQREIWQEITGLPFDALRAEAISGMNIKRDTQKFLKRLAA